MISDHKRVEAMRTTFVSALTFSLILAPSVTHAYYLETRGDTADPIRYADADPASDAVDVTYRVNAATFPPEVAGAADAIDAAFAAWTDAECGSIAFRGGESSDSIDRAHWIHDEGAIYVLVYFSASDEEWTGGPAAGHFWFGYDPSGALIGATVVLNSRDHAWATDGSADKLDVQGVVTALIGRSLGITSAMEGNATYPSYAPGDVSKRALGDDDLAALAYLYPTSTCSAPAEPEAVCDGAHTSGAEACPPRPMTMPGDAGTLVPGDDAGPIGYDGGVPNESDASTDTGATSGGCSVGSGRASAALAWSMALIAMALVRRRRR